MNGLVKRLKARGARVKVDTAGRVVGVRYTDRVIEKTDLDLLVECRVLQRLRTSQTMIRLLQRRGLFSPICRDRLPPQ